MKTTFLLLAALLATITTQASEKGDTIVVENARRVTIVNGDSLLKISINGTAKDSAYRYEAMMQAVDSNFVSKETMGKDFEFNIGSWGKQNDEYSSTCNLHFMVGLNGATGSPDDLSTTYGKSFEIGTWLDFTTHPWHNGHSLSIGYGIDWRKYSMTGRSQFVKADNGSVGVEPLPQNADPDFSRILTFGFMFPLQYGYSHKGWGFSVGPMLNITTHATILTKYKLDGEKQKAKHNHIHQNRITVDLMGTMKTPWLSLYVKYNPCNVLDTRFGPKFHSLSFGIFL